MPTLLELLYCPTCGHDSPAEVPPCSDGHGATCPDRACIECGTALLLDVAPVERRPAHRSAA